MSDQGTPVPDEDRETQEKLTERFKELEKKLEDKDNTTDISDEQFGKKT